MNTKLILRIHDKDGSPSEGYPIQVSLSKHAEDYDPVGQVKDSVTGYTNQMVTAFTDSSGRAPIEILPFNASTFKSTKNFETIVSDGEVGDIGYEMPLSAEVLLTESSVSGPSSQYKIIKMSNLYATETIETSGTAEGFSVFELPEDKRPYPTEFTCEDVYSEKIYLFHNLHPDYEPGINFFPGDMLSDRFLYNLMANVIFIPDEKVVSIVARYRIRPFYVDGNDPTTLKVYDPSSDVNLAPQQNIYDKLDKSIHNNGLISKENALSSISVQSKTKTGASYRDYEGNEITGNVDIYPDIKLYLWVEYPNPDGPAPIRNVHEVFLPGPLYDINESQIYMRG